MKNFFSANTTTFGSIQLSSRSCSVHHEKFIKQKSGNRQHWKQKIQIHRNHRKNSATHRDSDHLTSDSPYRPGASPVSSQYDSKRT